MSKGKKTADELYRDNLISAIKSKDIDEYKRVVPYVRDVDGVLEELIDNKLLIRQEIFSDMIDRIKNPQLVKKIIEYAVTKRYDRNLGGMYQKQMKKLLDRVSDQDVVEKLLRESIKHAAVEDVRLLQSYVRDKTIFEKELIRAYTKDGDAPRQIVGMLFDNVQNHEVLLEVEGLALQNRANKKLGGMISSQSERLLRKINETRPFEANFHTQNGQSSTSFPSIYTAVALKSDVPSVRSDPEFLTGMALLVLTVLNLCGFKRAKVQDMPQQIDIDKPYPDLNLSPYLQSLFATTPEVRPYAEFIKHHVEETKKTSWTEQELIDFVQSEKFARLRADIVEREKSSRKATASDFGIEEGKKVGRNQNPPKVEASRYKGQGRG